jgi:Subtilase family
MSLKNYTLLALALFLVTPRAASPAGSVVSEGDHILRADLARATFGVTGRTVRVGVISGGISGLDRAKATADLPLEACGPQSSGQTIIDPNLCQGIGIAVDTNTEGTAMLEIIHDLAPDAELLFCAPRTRLGMVACINFLAERVKVIVDDFGFLGEGYFEDGMVAQTAANAVATGVVFVSAAGNEADVHYQSMYVNSGDGLGSHLIGPGNTAFDVTGLGAVVFLQWSNRFGAATDNYDLCIAGETPEECASFNSVQDGDDDPQEVRLCLAGCNLQVRLVSGAPQLLELFFIDGTLAGADHVAADSVFGHPAVPGVLAVAAIDANDPSHDDIEIFSSRGPSTIVFPAPETRQKPNVAAIDNVLISGAGGFPDPQGGSPQRFHGTSAAAPHAAAVVALMVEANPRLTPAEVQQILQQTTFPLGSSVPNFGSGFGRIDAFAAVQTVKLQTTALLAAVLPSSRSVQVGGWVRR